MVLIDDLSEFVLSLKSVLFLTATLPISRMVIATNPQALDVPIGPHVHEYANGFS